MPQKCPRVEEEVLLDALPAMLALRAVASSRAPVVRSARRHMAVGSFERLLKRLPGGHYVHVSVGFCIVMGVGAHPARARSKRVHPLKLARARKTQAWRPSHTRKPRPATTIFRRRSASRRRLSSESARAGSGRRPNNMLSQARGGRPGNAGKGEGACARAPRDDSRARAPLVGEIRKNRRPEHQVRRPLPGF